jgi:creatinine amidohydrolase/Fe(II)-dependent formamide hydrolase-like protein
MGYRVNDMLQPLPFTMINEFDELSHNGVIGMPEEASAEKGSQFLEAAAQAVAALIDEMGEWKFQERGPAIP